MGLPNSKAEWIECGWGAVNVGVDAAPSIDRNDVARRLADVLDDPNWSPPVLPEVAARLIETTRNPNASVAEVAHILKGDPTLAAQLLRRANSAAYAAKIKAQTVCDAAVRVGIQGVRNLALEIALSMRIFRAEGYQPFADALRRHSVASAYLTGMVCRYAGINKEEAFLCGLLADMGLAVGLMVLGERTRGLKRPDLSFVWPSLIEVHEELSARMATRWNLAPETALVLANHHRLTIDGEVHPMIAVVMVSSGLAEKLGVRFPSPPDATTVPMANLEREARAWLGLTDRHMELLLVEGKKQLIELSR